MLYIGYKYESALGKEVNKVVLCKDESEYRRMKSKIEDAGMEVIEFVQAYKASAVLGYGKYTEK